MTVGEYWNHYLKATGKSFEEAVYSGELVFENGGCFGDEQLRLVLGGRKTASFSFFDSLVINREPIPVAGEVYIVEDSSGEPSCIIELTDVKIVPFNEISWELASLDGEDENLAQWREKMRCFAEEESDACGFAFSEESKIVCEIFKVIFR